MADSRPIRERPAGGAPEVWGRIPPRNKNFTGRDELLARLRAGIAGQPTAVVPHALHGIGGVGKTQMAIEYAYRHRSDYDLVWWIAADQSVLVRASLAGLAPYLGLPPASSSGAGIDDSANAVLDALRRGEPYANWLLIFDNADQPEDLTEVIPHGPGHVLITSRNHRWDAVVDTVAVDVFTRAESVEFLNKRVRRAITGEEADRLADALGDLPLALEQAGALQAETGMSVSEYLDLLDERTSQLLSEGKPSEYPVPMTAAWAVSVASLRDNMPEAVDLLRCCAFFGPEPIPRDMFSQPRAGVGPDLAGLVTDPIRLSRAIAELGRYALARIDVAGRTIQIHRLVQALVRDELSPAEQQRVRATVHLLLAGYAPADPDDPDNWPRYRNLLGHIRPAGVADSTVSEVHELALTMVRYLFASSDLSSARTLVELLLGPWTAQCGDEHVDVLTLRTDLADILRELGRYGEAHRENTATLALAEKTLGPDHELTLRLMRGNGADLRAQGAFREALARNQEVLRRCEAKFGPDDPRTLRTINSLAIDQGLSSAYTEARRLHERAYLGQLTAESESTVKGSLLSAWSGLARAVRLCGDYAEACDLGEEAYAYAAEQLGPEHNWTLRTGRDLAIAWRRAGDLDRALELALDVQARYVRLFGLDHPDTLAAAMCLSNVRRTIGEIDEATVLAEDTVRRYPRIYGPEHPYNHACVGNLAVLRRVQGDPRAARALNEKALVGLEAKLSRDHNYTLIVAANLAGDLAALGQTEDACRLGRGTLRRLRALLGPAHPMTLLCAANLSIDLLADGHGEEGTGLYEETKAAYAATLGLQHLDARTFLAARHLDADFDPPPI